MNRPPESELPDPVAPGCRPTTDRLQSVLDGVTSAAALDTDAHAVVCPVCRDRIRAARVLLAGLPTVTAPPSMPVDLAGSILAAVRSDGRARYRRRVFAAAGGLAIAATVAVVVWLRWPTPQPPTTPHAETVNAPQTPPPEPPRPQHEPVRIADHLARVGDALRETSRPITGPAASAPPVFSALANSLSRAATAPALSKLEPARNTLAELPEAASVGFEPVTGTARKGLNRFLHDVSAIQPNGPN
jgi:hypothetical protein